MLIELAYNVDFNVHATPPMRIGPDWVFDYKHLFESFYVFPDVLTSNLETVIGLIYDDEAVTPRTVISPRTSKYTPTQTQPTHKTHQSQL